jgi:hypothetical protein
VPRDESVLKNPSRTSFVDTSFQDWHYARSQIGAVQVPVAGCTTRVTQDQLEDDAAKALLVRREIREN